MLTGSKACHRIFFSFALIFTSSWGFGAPYSGYDDLRIPYPGVSYENSQDELSIFDEVRLHAGVALLNSFQDFQISPGIRERGGIKGFDLNFGADLFSENWIAEGHVVGYPESNMGRSRLASSGFELRLLYDKPILTALTLHGGLGVGSRSYSVKIAGSPDQSFNSACTVLAFGGEYWITGQASAGIELTNHLPMASGDDPTSMDLGMKFTGHF